MIWYIEALLSLVLAGTAVTLAGGALVGPPGNSFTRRSLFAWSTFGPHLVLLSLVALMVGVAGLRRKAHRFASVLTSLAVFALLGSLMITAQIVIATYMGGGSANPITSLLIGSIAAASPDAREVYTTAEGRPLEALIYRPRNASGSAPVMLYIHGGGWISGTPAGSAADRRWFADQGWLSISVEYRLASAGEATWNKAPQDVACALVWVSQHAARFGGDPQRIVVAGPSAGGNLAINLAYAAAAGQAQSGCGGQVPVPAAVVAYYPLVDPQDAYDHGHGARDPGMNPRVFTSRYIGGTPQQHPDRMRTISAATYLSDKAPQTLIIEPEKDGVIPAAGVYRFVDQALAADVNITLVRIPFADHGFTEASANSLGNQTGRSITLHYLMQRNLGPRRP